MFEQIRMNWKSGLSVALISVPLSLSLGIASGATPIAGIITAIWAGIVGGLIGGSQFNIIGPAGALSGILAAYALQYGAGILPFLAIGAAVIGLIVWALNWDKYLIFIPSSVVHGFTLGVAFTIGLGQLNSALGLSGLPVHETLLENIGESLRHLSNINLTALVPFLLGLALLFFILKKKPLWPNSIIVALVGILVGYASVHNFLPVHLITLGDKYPALDLHLFSIPSFAAMTANPAFANLTFFAQVLFILRLSAVIAFVAILETLLSGKIADGATKTKFNQRREVLSVSLANLVAGFFGGVPASGVFARTAMNIKSGAKSQYSQFINALFVALITFILLPVFGYIPMSIIAAILVYVAMRMVTGEHFKKLYGYDKIAFWTAMAVAVLSVAYDATTGILVGTAVALLVLVRKISVAQSNITIGMTEPLTTNKDADVIVYRFAGELTYLNSKSHAEMIAGLAPKKAVVLNFRNLFYIDLDGVEALDEMIGGLTTRGNEVAVCGLHPQVAEMVKNEEWYKERLQDGHICDTTEKALATVHAH